MQPQMCYILVSYKGVARVARENTLFFWCVYRVFNMVYIVDVYIGVLCKGYFVEIILVLVQCYFSVYLLSCLFSRI